MQRERAMAAELGVGVRTMQKRRARYARQGLWGLVDQRVAREWTATGRVDARLVTAIRQVIQSETDTSTGTRSRLIRRATQAVEAEHGPGVVPLPGRSTLYKLIEVLAAGRHTFGSAVTRRQTANRPQGVFTPSFAARPGEQVQIDSTPIDVQVLLDNGVPARADLTIAVDVATRTICAAVLRPVGTKAVDAALLLAKMLLPEPMRPGWSQTLRMSASVLPHARLLDIDARMELAAARPVIVPDTIVIDHGKVFVSDTFTRACDRLGVTVQPARPGTPTDKPVVEATFESINTLFCQHVASYTGSNTTLRGTDVTGAWTLPELQDLLDEWLLVGWQPRPHGALRDPLAPRRMLSPNEKYAALVAAAGYLPLTLSGEDYLELLPVAWRQINAYGIRIDYRTYDCPELGPLRLQHSGVAARRGLWEVHYDPYDVAQVFVRTGDGWVTVPWTQPADGDRAVCRVHLAARSPAHRAGRSRRHERDRGGPRAGRPAHPSASRAGRQAQRPSRGPHPRGRGSAPAAAPGGADRRAGRGAGHRVGERDPVRGLRRRRRGGQVVTRGARDEPDAGAAGMDEPLTTKEGWRRFVDRQPCARPAQSGHRRAAHRDRAGRLRRDPPGLPRGPALGEHADDPESDRHRPAAGAAEPQPGLRPTRADRLRRVRDRQDHRADPAGPPT